MSSTNRDQEVFPPGQPSGLEAGAFIGRYLILGRVGSGAMGVVYGAYDPELDRKIALKLLDRDGGEQEATARARLLREAKAMARLADPNVIAVHDVGVFQGRVFLAMEFLGGGTLKSWLVAGLRGWREVLEVFLAAGRGLAAAHAAGLVHRDFKPENVLLDREGRPRVVDFGLAREAAAGEAQPPGTREAALAEVSSSGDEASASPLATLTRTGAIMGTPAYMAPEQFLGEPTDERTDQFGFCVALYEALYGERPFTGESMLKLLHSVTAGELRPAPDDREVPAWIRRAILRGLKADPADRWASMTPLIAALEDDPAARGRRRLLAVAVAGVVLASVVAVAQSISHRRQEVQRQVAPHLDEAVRSSGVGRARAADLREMRRRAFAAFDAPDRARGETLWKRALAVVPAVEAAYDRAEQSYETALVLDPSREDVRAKLADLLYEHLLLADELRRKDRARTIAARLERHDQGGARRTALEAPGWLVLRATRPQPAAVALERYERELDDGRRPLHPVPPPAATGAPVALAPGSYRLILRAPGRAEVVYPFELRRAERLEVDLALPPASAVPHGFAYVPPGELWFGDADEQLRTGFLGAVPIHRRRTGAYLIARHEVTYAEWIAFLDSLPQPERARHAPNISTGLRGKLRLREADGAWQLTFQHASQRYVARAGQTFVYHGRQLRKQQDWLRLPVAGVSAVDARRYLGWLRASGAVPGARMCSELEWERAARGADDRLYPHGDDLQADDANFDQTYGRIDSAFGPDEVGSHPASRSPFGVDDLAGNLLELVSSSERAGEIAVRGGAYYFSSYTCRATNREVMPPSQQDVTMGLRVCASLEEGTHEAP